MDNGFAAAYSDSDTLIFDKKWTNFDSEVFLFGEQSSVMKDGSQSFNPVVGSGSGSSSMIHNNDHNNVENMVVKLEPAHDHEDFNTCMDQLEMWSKTATKAYKERESALQHSVQINQASFQQQINQRDEIIASLQKENEQNKLRIHQLERQLFEKEMLVMSYRGQLRDANFKSGEYYRPSLQQQVNMTPPHLNINGCWSAGGGASVSVLRSRGNDSAPIIID